MTEKDERRDEGRKVEDEEEEHAGESGEEIRVKYSACTEEKKTRQSVGGLKRQRE